jgi:tRNA-dihydrouridine synthase
VAEQKCKETGADGAMLGRAVFGNPFIFSSKQATASERLQALMEHINLFEINLGGIKSFAVMKKHFKSYLTMIVSADPDVARQAQIRELGSQLMLVAEADQAIHLIKQMLSLYN